MILVGWIIKFGFGEICFVSLCFLWLVLRVVVRGFFLLLLTLFLVLCCSLVWLVLVQFFRLGLVLSRFRVGLLCKGIWQVVHGFLVG